MKETKYGRAQYSIFTIDTHNGKMVTPTCIFNYVYPTGSETEIKYHYDVKGNTVGSEHFKYVSRAEFYRLLREIEIRQKIKISIKKNWI